MSIEFTIFNAIRDSDAEQLEALLEKPDNVSRLAKSLHLGKTFQTDSLEIVRKLISFEEIRSVLGQDRLAVLRYAIIGNNPEVVKALLELDEVRNNSMVSNNQVLAVAIMQNNLEMVKMLLKIPDIRKNLLNGEYGILGDNSFFGYAAFAGQTEIIKYLLEIDEIKENAAKMDNAALKLAILGGHHDITNLLLTNEADLNKGDRPDLCKVDILGEPHYFTFNNLVRCPTAGGQSFFTGVELCLDHSYGVMKNNFNNIVLQHVESLVEGVESDPLPTRFSHVISSNSCQVIEEHTIGLPTHADPSSAFLEKNEKMAPFFGHEGKPKKSDPKSYSMPLSFGATVTLMKTKPFVVENVEFLSRLQNGVKESTRASKENENRKSLLFKKMHTDIQEPLQEPLVQKTTHNEPVDSQRKKTH